VKTDNDQARVERDIHVNIYRHCVVEIRGAYYTFVHIICENSR